MLRLPVIAACAGLFAAEALANDTSAELKTGGLVLEKNASVEMRSEDLSISLDAIVVRYTFFNRAAKDEDLLVAFPMPDVTWDGPDTNIVIPEPNSPNFLDFHTSVDGAEVQSQVERKAVFKGQDITARLTQLGVPLEPWNEAIQAKLDALAQPDKDRLLKAGIVVPDDYDVGKGWEHHFSPMWTFKSVFTWRQVFPAGREITVEHRYKPSVGETTGTSVGTNYGEPARQRDYAARYCIDRDFLAAVKKATPPPDKSGVAVPPFFERRIAYVLTTGANWAGPIGDFHLTIDKGAPDSLVSFCADGVKKTGETRFEATAKNFTPTRDLNVLILYRPKP